MHVEVDPLLPSGIMQADFALIMGLSLFVEQKSEEKDSGGLSCHPSFTDKFLPHVHLHVDMLHP